MGNLADRLYRKLTRNELTGVGWLLLVGLGVWAFVEIAGDVIQGDTHAWDTSWLLHLRTPGDPSDPIGPDWFEEGMRDLTAMGSVVALGSFAGAAVGLLYLKRRPWVAAFVLIAVLSGTGVSTIMKSSFDRPRPELVPHETEIYTKSFPSGHSAMSSLVYLTLAAVAARTERDRRTKRFLVGLAIVLSLAIAVSRVYLGVHWPSDVAAGWVFGTTWAIASWLAFRWLQRRYRWSSRTDRDDVPERPGPANRSPDRTRLTPDDRSEGIPPGPVQPGRAPAARLV